MSFYTYDNQINQYRITGKNYTGPHTKVKDRSLTDKELEHFKIRQLEKIASSLEAILDVLSESLYNKQNSQTDK